MIDDEEGLKVRVREFASKGIYGEFKPAPQSPLYKADKRHRMIPATTDEKFDIEIVLSSKFDFKGQRYVRAKVEFDGGVRTISKHIFNNSIRSVKGGERELKYHFQAIKGQKDGQWVYLGFTFGELKVDKDLVLSPEEEARHAANCGTIKVTLQRGWAVRTEEEGPEDTNIQRIPSLKTSEKVVVEHGKTHGFKRSIGGATTPDLFKWTFHPAEGEAGEPIVYTFTYVSRDIIEANKEKLFPKLGASIGAKLKKTVTNAPVSAKENKETGPKGRELIEIDDEDKPYKVIKIEPPELEHLFSTPTPRKQSTALEWFKIKPAVTPKPKPAEKPEAKPVEKAGAKATTNDSEKAAMPVAKETAKSKEKEEKDKKTAKIEMKLKANRLKQEEIELIQERMELHGE